MAGFGGAGAAHNAVTRGRKTTVEWDVPEPGLQRPPWSIRRQAGEIARASAAGTGSSINTMLLGSGAWCLEPYQVTYRWEETITQAGILRASDFNLGQGLLEIPLQRAPTDLAGANVSAGVAASGDQFLLKRVPANQSWDSHLASDAAALPQPGSVISSTPMDRVASGRTTHPENQGFALRFHVPGIQVGAHEGLLTFYFGGGANRDAAGRGPFDELGRFALTLYGSGKALLHEFTGAAWRAVQNFRWTNHAQVGGRAHSLIVQPHDGHGHDALHIIVPSVDRPAEPKAIPYPSYAPYPPNPGEITFRRPRRQAASPVPPPHTMTGPGTVRIDVSRQYRIPFQVSTLRYPTEGYVVDHPFTLPFRLPAETLLTLQPEKSEPTGTAITATIKDATTFAALNEPTPGQFESVDGQNCYFVEFRLTGPGTATPFLYAFEVLVQGELVERTVPAWTGGATKRVAISGPDLDPTHESASLEIEDPYNVLARLRARSRIHLKIKTQYDENDASKTCVLFEGESARATATKKPGASRRSASSWPHPEWRHYAVQCVSMWARLSDQFSLVLKDFAEDPTATPLPNGTRPPWKVTAIIQWLFEAAGIPADQIDVPDLPVRAFFSGADKNEFLLQPAANLLDYIQRLARQYLGYFVVWDANAGTRGMWRVLPPATPPYNVLWNFQTAGPAGGRVASDPRAYPARTTFIRSLETYVKPPEANLIIIITGDAALPAGGGPTIRVRFLANYTSFDPDPANPTADPDHPDYLGRCVPLVYYEPTVWSRGGANILTRRLYDQVAHAQKWAGFQAPLILMNDSTDTQLGTKVRPLRVYDAVKVNALNAVVRSVNADYASDRAQMAQYEAQILADAASVTSV